MRLFSALALFVSLNASASAADFTTLHKQGLDAVVRADFAAAAALFRQSAAIALNDEERGLAANDLGIILHQLGRDKEARPHLEIAFHIWQQARGSKDRLAQTAEGLAAVDRTLGDYTSAEADLREALKTPPADDENFALILNELGDVLREVGRQTEASHFLEKTLSLPGISVRRRLDANLALADIDRDARRFQSSTDRWNYAAQTARENHWTLLEASAIRGLGVTYLENNEPARAEPLLRRALSLLETSNAPLHQVSSALSCLAQLYITENKFALAENALLRALEMTEKTLSPTHPQVAILLEMLGETAAGRNQLDSARDYYSRAHTIMAARFGDRSPIAAAVEGSWALIEHHAKRHTEAAADYEKALEILDAAGPEVEPLRSIIHQRYAEVCKTLHRKPAVNADSFGAQSFRASDPRSSSR